LAQAISRRGEPRCAAGVKTRAPFVLRCPGSQPFEALRRHRIGVVDLYSR
jgi:hypothetical protein